MKKGYLEYVVELRDRNETLRNLLAAYAKRYKCQCGHHWCKRCEMDRQAAEILGGDR